MAAPKNAQELFDDQMPKALAGSPDKAREVGSIYVFKISGEGGGDWTIDLKSATPSVTKGVLPGADCTLEIANADFVSMLTNPALGMQLFMQGKLKVTGDPMLAMKLQKLFSLGT
jgi:putative sterol carrier protein